MEGSEKMKEQTTIRLPSEMKEEIQREAEERGITIRDVPSEMPSHRSRKLS
jgi:LDH2 family malate/lactate/ureidoglycolate dehydrogenase